MKAFITTYWGKDFAKESTLGLQPIRDIHFDQRFLHTYTYTTTSRQTYYGLAGIALFIILIACINFVNLATGLATTRAKEVGVRKVLGARRPQLVWQFLGETAVLVLFCIGLGLLTASLVIPTVDRWLDIRVHTEELFEPVVLGVLGGVLVGVILLAGVYPAFVQSAFRPALSLKGESKLGGRGLMNLRKGLVVVQFAICQLLIIGTLVVARQMDYFENQDLGYDKESVVSFPMPDGNSRTVIAQTLASEPGVTAYSFSTGAPANSGNWAPFHSTEFGLPKDEPTELKFIDERYIHMFGLTMLAGDTIRPKVAGDSVYRVVVNETLLGELHLNPAGAVGKQFNLMGNNAEIIGVVQDFQSESKHQKRRPCVLLYDTGGFYRASIRIYPQALRETLAHVSKVWSGINPRGIFEYEFLDDYIASLYRQEQKVYTAIRLFSIIAILIGCLGLYGLVAFAAMQRTKEVGIRKVLGASIGNIVYLFTREFIVLIGVAFVIAAPVAWLIMHRWLESFAYRIGISWGLFAAAILVSFAIAAFTISWESIKAAVVNPVKSLRSE